MSFNVPINTIAPLPTPSDWTRPSDWINITDTPNEVQFLVADVNLKCFSIITTFIKNSGTNIYIDWGDGVINTISTITSTTTEHVYSTGGTPCSRGYNTFKIRIYGDATCQITNAQHVANFTVTGGAPFYNVGLLEAYFGNNTCNTAAINPYYFTSIQGNISIAEAKASFGFLEYIKFPSSISYANMDYICYGCVNLYKIIMPTSATNLVSISSSFFNCINLRDLALPEDATNINSFLNTFTYCNALRTVTFPSNLNKVTSFSQAFLGCKAIKNITLPSIDLCVNLQQTFNSCGSLQWVKFTSLPSPISSGISISLSSTFSLCYNLQNVYFPSACSTNSIYDCTNIFSECTVLKNITFPNGLNATSMGGAFTNCFNIVSVTFPPSMPSLNTFATVFSGCKNLINVILPTTVSSSISLSSAFNLCAAISDITIPSSYIITNLSSAFTGCQSLKNITLPNNAQNSCTAMNSMANACYKLETITMPTSLTAVSNLATCFFSCYSLKSVTFPSTMNSVASFNQAFSNCYNLENIVMPTSVSLCNNFTSIFSNCYSLTSITLPATISATTTGFASLFQNCFSLKTIVLPDTQTSGLTTIDLFIQKCGSLVSIANIDKLGSPTLSGTLVSASGNTYCNSITSLSFSCPFSVIAFNGVSATNFNKLNSLRLLNTRTGQWTGASPQINVSYCNLSATALNQLFTDLTTIVSKTINITGCTGAGICTRSIATAKGWTVIG